MSMPFYASAEQIMRDRSEYARKGIARGRSVVVLTYADGVLFVAENPSPSTLHKVSEIYDRIGFAAVGKYNEFENLRVAGIRLADLRGYSYDRRDVTARALANAYSQGLGTIFTEQQKPYEVELCVAEVGHQPGTDQLYRLSYDGTIVDESNFLVMGGQAEAVAAQVKSSFRANLPLAEAIAVAVGGLGSVGGDGNGVRSLVAEGLEVAVLDRNRGKRTFRRITGAALSSLLPAAAGSGESTDDTTAEPERPVGPRSQTEGASAAAQEAAVPAEAAPAEDAPDEGGAAKGAPAEGDPDSSGQ
jgi:proteasome alpha subunit